jgi:type I restriction enzyme S subunit
MTEGNGEARELPKGWILVQHKDIAEINPKLPFNDLSDDLLVSFLPMAAVEEKSSRFSLSETREYGKVKKGYTQFINGDLIFAKITPCMENGKVAVVENLKNGIGFGSTEFHVSRLTSLTSRKYLFYYFVQEKFRRDARQNMTGSAGQLRVSKSYFEEIKIPLAPLLEQDRIVERIEELFSDVDKGVESLKTAQKQLKVYRQAVLKWAFEGKLTEAWRTQHSSILKTGEALLAEIKAERYSNYQSKYSDPVLPKDNPFQELPESWCLVTLDQVSVLVTSGSRGWAKYYSNTGSYFIRAQDINTNELNLKNIAYVSLPEGIEGERTRIQTGDILITITGANVTKTALVTLNLKKEAYVNQHIGLVRLVETVSRKFIYWWLISFKHGHAQLMVAAYGAGKPGLNLTNLKEVFITLPSLEEQEEIVQEIESRLSTCDQLDASIIENLQKAEALRQSILKQAFEGKLVPQDPNDEPAEKLLERIQAERQVNGNTG